MCFEGVTYCVKKKHIAKRMNCGFTLGPCDAQQSAACSNTYPADTSVSCVCSGKLVSIFVRYIGPSFQDVNVSAKKCNVPLAGFSGLMTGDVFDVNASDGGLLYLRKETYFELAGTGYGQIKIPTNCCDNPVGRVFYPFEVIGWVDTDGNECPGSGAKNGGWSDSDKNTPVLDEELASLTQYPNPAENISNIEFSVPEPQKVNVTILNIQGQIVETLFNADVEANENYKLVYDVTDLQSGIYFIHLKTSNDVIKKKFVILK